MAKRADPNKYTITKEYLLPGLFFAFFVRWCVAAYPYSGYKKPPMYGDYEAQRHWQEITLQTPIGNWYRNTTQNDLQYWGLDYPPLTAYHSYLIGLVADWLDPESVRLFASRGYESDFHKTFMRWTVFLSDLYFYVSAVIALCIGAERIVDKRNFSVFKRTDLCTILFLLYPGLIIIDHGHFQYNCVSLGLFLWATHFIIGMDNDILASICFVFALNYKQMELYHALPFFIYLLRKCFICLPKKGKMLEVINRLTELGVAVITTFILIWYRLIISWDYFFQIVHRLFPIKRGVFEDKVSNFWCLLNIFVKLKNAYTNEDMMQICLVCTIIAALPSCLDLFFRTSKKKFVLSLINVSLAFFLFSYQVHEKSILLAAIPVAIYFPEDPFMCFWFLLVSSFSMLPLLIKDGLILPFVCTNVIYLCVYNITIKLSDKKASIFSFLNAQRVYSVANRTGTANSLLLKFLSANFICSLQGMFWICLCTLFVQPPDKYPDLFPLLISVYSCVHFIFFLVYFTYQQLSLPTCLPNIAKVKSS